MSQRIRALFFFGFFLLPWFPFFITLWSPTNWLRKESKMKNFQWFKRVFVSRNEESILAPFFERCETIFHVCFRVFSLFWLGISCEEFWEKDWKWTFDANFGGILQGRSKKIDWHWVEFISSIYKEVFIDIIHHKNKNKCIIDSFWDKHFFVNFQDSTMWCHKFIESRFD